MENILHCFLLFFRSLCSLSNTFCFSFPFFACVRGCFYAGCFHVWRSLNRAHFRRQNDLGTRRRDTYAHISITTIYAQRRRKKNLSMTWEETKTRIVRRLPQNSGIFMSRPFPHFRRCFAATFLEHTTPNFSREKGKKCRFKKVYEDNRRLLQHFCLESFSAHARHSQERLGNIDGSIIKRLEQM